MRIVCCAHTQTRAVREPSAPRPPARCTRQPSNAVCKMTRGKMCKLSAQSPCSRSKNGVSRRGLPPDTVCTHRNPCPRDSCFAAIQERAALPLACSPAARHSGAPGMSLYRKGKQALRWGGPAPRSDCTTAHLRTTANPSLRSLHSAPGARALPHRPYRHCKRTRPPSRGRRPSTCRQPPAQTGRRHGSGGGAARCAALWISRRASKTKARARRPQPGARGEIRLTASKTVLCMGPPARAARMRWRTRPGGSARGPGDPESKP
jgi:hypothetical protein